MRGEMLRVWGILYNGDGGVGVFVYVGMDAFVGAADVFGKPGVGEEVAAASAGFPGKRWNV